MAPVDQNQEEVVVSELKKRLEDEDLSPEQKLRLLSGSLHQLLDAAAMRADSGALPRLKSRLYLSGVLSHCIHALDPRMPRGDWSAAATLAHLTSSCCVGAEPGQHSEAFDRLFLPSVMDALLSLASHLLRTEESRSVFRRLMSSTLWLLTSCPQLTSQVLSSAHYEQIQMCDDVTVSLLCVQMWIQICSTSRDFLFALTDDDLLLLLNEAVGQLATTSDPAVGGVSVRLILLMASQLKLRLQPLLLSFRGLDSLLDKDWRGRGFDDGVDQLIALVRSEEDAVSTEHVRAACVIQAAWRSYRTRRRVKSLRRAVSSLQRTFRARRRRRQQQQEAELWEEELQYQVCVRRQQARRKFHQKQRRLLQLLPADQVQSYLQECERRAAVVIQSFWRGCRERRRYDNTLRRTHTHTRQQAARTLQRAVRCFLQRRRAAKAPPLAPLWIGQKGLTDSRRAELKQQVEEYIAVHPSSCVSPEDCERLHQEVQLLLEAELQRGAQRRRAEQRVEALLAHTHTQLELLRDAPPLSVVTVTAADSFLSPSGPVAARARDAHNATLQAGRLPWWRTLHGQGEAEPGHALDPAHLQELEAELGGLYVGGVGGSNL